MSIVENYQIIQELKKEVKNLLVPRVVNYYIEVENKIKEGFHEIEVTDLRAYEKQAKTTASKGIFLIFSLNCSLLKRKKNAISLKNPSILVMEKEVMEVTRLERLTGENKDVMIDRVVSSLQAGMDVFLNNAMKIFSKEKEEKENRAKAYQRKKKEREFNRFYNSFWVGG
ncbi:hypothetical protein ACOWOG_07460 [Helicobacter pylori]